jgi:WD40 repeat protein
MLRQKLFLLWAAGLVSLGTAPALVRSAAPPAFHDDPLPSGAKARLGSLRWRHANSIGALALSPDGKMFASHGGGVQKITLRLWDAATGVERCELIPDGGFYSLAWSSDGKILASGGSGGEILFWDPTTYKRRVLGSHPLSNCVSALAFSPVGRVLASGGKDIRLWDVAAGKLLRVILRGGNSVEALAFSPDGKFLAGDDSGRVRIWDTSTGKAVRRMDEVVGVDALAFSPDGRYLAGGGPDDHTLLWDARTGKLIRSFKGYALGISALAFSPDGSLLVSGGGRRGDPYHCNDTAVRLWDVSTGKLRWKFPGDGHSVYSVGFMPGGKTVFAGASMIRLWDVATGKRLYARPGHEDGIAGAVFSRNRNELVTLGYDRTARLWNVESGKQLRCVSSPPMDGWPIALSPTGDRAAGELDALGPLAVWDTATGKVLRELKRPPGRSVHTLAFSASGEQLAVRFRDTPIHVWDLANGRLRTKLPGLDSPSSEILAFSPGGTYLGNVGSISWDKAVVQLYDLRTGKILHQLNSSLSISCLAFSPDGATLVLGNENFKSVEGWEILTGKKRWSLKGIDKPPSAVQFAPSGLQLAVGLGNAFGLWDLATGKLLYRAGGHREAVTHLAFSPRGGLLVTASRDTTALVWDVSRFFSPPPRGSAPTANELDSLWSDLAGDDAQKAYRALLRLAAAPAESQAILARRLRPPAPTDARQVAGWLTGLDSDDFNERERATNELSKAGVLAEPALRRALAAKPSAEATRRIKRLLLRISQDELFALRFVESLELAGTREARRLLARLANGLAQAPLTQKSRAALRRLGR